MNGYKWSAVSNIWNSIASAKAHYFQLGRTRPILDIGPNVRSSGFPIRCLAIIIASPPLSFVRSGYTALNQGTIRNLDYRSYAWAMSTSSFTSITSAVTYSLNFYTKGVYTSDGPYDRWRGLPIR